MGRGRRLLGHPGFLPLRSSGEQDISLGRYPDGADYWVWFATPTPDATNNYAIILGQDELNAPVNGVSLPIRRRTGWTGKVDAAGRVRPPPAVCL